MHEGRCLCGAVRVTAELAAEVSACFCTLCTRWGGGVQMGIEADPASVTITGPVKVHRSSRIAERAWCDTCGSAVWLRDVEGEGGAGTAWFELSPGLFDNAGGARLTRIVFADRAPDGLRLEGDGVERVSAAEYAERHPVLSSEETP